MTTTHSFEQAELQLIITALQATDPTGIYTKAFVEKLIKEANEQLAKPTPTKVKEEKPRD